MVLSPCVSKKDCTPWNLFLLDDVVEVYVCTCSLSVFYSRLATGSGQGLILSLSYLSFSLSLTLTLSHSSVYSNFKAEPDIPRSE